MIVKNDKKNHELLFVNVFLILVTLAVIAVNIKSIFSDFGIDIEYALLTSYRNLRGDQMFAQMQEPHQTSSFLCSILMWMYFKIVGSSTGVVVFLQTCGVIIQFFVAIMLYLFLNKKINSTLSALICLCFATIYPKDFVFPEFSNMQVWFSVLMYVALMWYLEEKKSKLILILAGICLCLTILSYPSCIVLFFVVIFLLVIYSDKKLEDILIFLVTCVVCGLGYVFYFVVKLGLKEFLSGIYYIILNDSSHAANYGQSMYFVFLLEALKWFGMCLLFSSVISGLIYAVIRRGRKRYCWKKIFCGVFSISLLLTDIYRVIVMCERFSYIILWVVVIIISLFGFKYCNEEEMRLVKIGMCISLGCFLSTMLLTNLDFLSTVKYMSLALVLSFIPFSKLLERLYPGKKQVVSWWIIICFGFLLVFRKGFIVKTMDGQPSNLLDIPQYVKIQEGPARGIVSDYMGAAGANYQIREWKQHIRGGERVWIIGTEAVSNLAYMYGDVEICVPSTISTPTYGEMLEEYWEKYPQKMPTVVVIQYNDEGLLIQDNLWLKEWLNHKLEGCNYAQGEYWLYFYLKK